MTFEGRIAAGIAVIAAQLGVEIGAPDVRADDQAPLDVNQLRLGQRGRLEALRVTTRMLAGQFPSDRVAAKPVLPSELADGPTVVTKGFQFLVRFSRLHGEVSCGGVGLHTKSLTGGLSC